MDRTDRGNYAERLTSVLSDPDAAQRSNRLWDLVEDAYEDGYHDGQAQTRLTVEALGRGLGSELCERIAAGSRMLDVRADDARGPQDGALQ